MSTPEIIYLIPGEDIEGYPGKVWCESRAPSDHCDPDEAIKYVRFDVHDSIIDGQAAYAKMGMDAANGELTEENERLQARIAELECMIKVFRGCIDTQLLPGKGSPCHKMVWELVGAPDQSGDKQ